MKKDVAKLKKFKWMLNPRWRQKRISSQSISIIQQSSNNFFLEAIVFVERRDFR
jgi:hypothetical protein